MSLDAGVVQRTGLGDYCWEDRNRNGLQDEATPVEGVRVELWDRHGRQARTWTDYDGRYAFLDLLPGQWRVKFAPDPSTGYQFTQPHATGEPTATDSDADPGDGFTQWVTLGRGEFHSALDCGLVRGAPPEASPSPALPGPSPSDGPEDCELGPGTTLTVPCPRESELMEHCYRCFHADGEVVVCDGWSRRDVLRRCRLRACADLCPADYAPACTGDGRVHANGCFRALAQCAADVGEAPCPRPLPCPEVCPDGYAPVCADGRTYPNECFVARAHCGRPMPSTTPGVCDGGCPDLCPAVYDPVCGDNGRTYFSACLLHWMACHGAAVQVWRGMAWHGMAWPV